MDFDYSTKVKGLRAKLDDFMQSHVYPAESEYFQFLDSGETRWSIPPVMEDLKKKARK